MYMYVCTIYMCVCIVMFTHVFDNSQRSDAHLTLKGLECVFSSYGGAGGGRYIPEFQ